MSAPIPKSCVVCGRKVLDGTPRCDKHKVGGSAPSPCIVCSRSTRGRYCPEHEPKVDEAVRNAANPYRKAYKDPEYAHNRQIRYQRARGRCEGCGRAVGPGQWQCHHVVEVRKGGTHAVANLRILCTEGDDNCHKKVHQLLRAKH